MWKGMAKLMAKPKSHAFDPELAEGLRYLQREYQQRYGECKYSITERFAAPAAGSRELLHYLVGGLRFYR